jgi:DNA-binding MarR family transcriptional regulator
MKIEDEIQSSFRNDYQKLMVNLYLTHSRMSEPLTSVFKQYDLTSTQYNVLRILRGQKQKPASIGLIKERMIERNSDVSRIIDRLLKKKLIKRNENKLDRRQKDIVITETGLELVASIDKCHPQQDKRMSHLTDEEVTTLNDLLDKLRSVPEQ